LTLQNFETNIHQGIFKNCPVSVADVDVAEKIFGPDLGSLKGKSTWHPPARGKEDLIEIPPELTAEHESLTLYMDIVFVNGLPLLTSIDDTIKYRSVVPLTSRHSKVVYSALDTITRVYYKAGFNITTIHCDQEFKFMMDRISNYLDIEMTFLRRRATTAH
jgi:hypothetical protein